MIWLSTCWAESSRSMIFCFVWANVGTAIATAQTKITTLFISLISPLRKMIFVTHRQSTATLSTPCDRIEVGRDQQRTRATTGRDPPESPKHEILDRFSAGAASLTTMRRACGRLRMGCIRNKKLGLSDAVACQPSAPFPRSALLLFPVLVVRSVTSQDNGGRGSFRNHLVRGIAYVANNSEAAEERSRAPESPFSAQGVPAPAAAQQNKMPLSPASTPASRTSSATGRWAARLRHSDF